MRNDINVNREDVSRIFNYLLNYYKSSIDNMKIQLVDFFRENKKKYKKMTSTEIIESIVGEDKVNKTLSRIPITEEHHPDIEIPVSHKKLKLDQVDGGRRRVKKTNKKRNNKTKKRKTKKRNMKN
jgi:hypothetical protein